MKVQMVAKLWSLESTRRYSIVKVHGVVMMLRVMFSGIGQTGEKLKAKIGRDPGQRAPRFLNPT
jgi:hypothetical protein